MIGQPALLQGAERAHDPGHPRQRAEAAAVRGAGDPHVLHLARRPARSSRSCSTRIVRVPGVADPADDRRQQDGQHDHRARDGSGGARSSSASSTANDKPRAEIVVDVEILEVNRDAREAVRAQPAASTRSAASSRRRWRPGHGGGCRRTPAQRASATAVQPEHDHAGHQHGRLLPDRAAGRRAVPRDRLATEADRQAAAARRGGAEAHAEPRRRRSRCRRTDVHADRGGRRGDAAADLVRLPHRRRQRRDDAARHLRGRHHPGAVGREQHARRRTSNVAGQNAAVVRLAQGDDAAAAARRRVEPARRACCARTSAGRCAGFPGVHEPAGAASSCSRPTTSTIRRPTS